MADPGVPNLADPLTNAGRETESNSPEDFLWQVHEYTNEYIRFADTKAAFIAVASTTLIGTVLSASILNCFLLSLRQVTWYGWLAAIGLLLLFISTLLSLLAIRPRLWNKTPIGFIFWESISGHDSAAGFSQAVQATTSSQRTTEVAEHLFMLASVAKRKYAFVNYAIWVGIGGFVLTVIALFFQHALRE